MARPIKECEWKHDVKMGSQEKVVRHGGRLTSLLMEAGEARKKMKLPAKNSSFSF